MLIQNVEVYGLKQSIKRAKYPKSVDIESLNDELTPGIKSLGNAKRGSGHDNFLKGIVVQFDLTFTIKAWTEGERYHWFDIISSQSTMHRITKFDLDKVYIKYVDPRIIEIMKEKVKEYNDLSNNEYIKKEAEKDNAVKTLWQEELAEKYLQILYSNPCGCKLTAGMTTNYQQLKTIYHQRRTHRLPEWKIFCDWIETLPMFKELCLGGETNE
jgi:hypothetical protein